jgi:hypothetical protein
VDAELRIRTALGRIGADDVLEWAKANCTLSLVALNAQLDAGVSPNALERFMADRAKESNRYDAFVKVEAVRRLNQYFPGGFGCSEKQSYGLSAGWAMWASLFNHQHKDRARSVWSALEDSMRNHPEWCPTGPDDPLIAGAFRDLSFEPSHDQRRYEAIIARVWEVANRGNRRRSARRAVENFATASPGLGLYGVIVVDGQVCNGGFVQFYENTRGLPAPHGVEGFRALDRENFASLVRESLEHAVHDHTHLLDESIIFQDRTIGRPSRSFEELDQEYYALSESEGPSWLEKAMMKFVLDRPDLFD